MILEDERDARQAAVAKRLVTRARFRTPSSLEEWDGTVDRGITKVKLKSLARLDFFHRNENLILEGKTGVGKTHLAISLGNRLCLDGIATKFYSTNLLFEEVQAEKAAGRYLKFLGQIKRTKVLILDDFALRNYTHDEANTLLEILEDRYRNGVAIITSQVAPEGWKGLFEDPVIGEAITDRLINPSDRQTLTGESYRTKLGRN